MSVKLYLWTASPPLASRRLQSLTRVGFPVLLVGLLAMGYYILHPHSPTAQEPPAAAVSGADRLREQLETGTPPERREALLRLIATRAEPQLTRCLASHDPNVVQFAATGLWECWLGEEGSDARREIERGTDAMNKGDLDGAAAVFIRLMADYPHWAEPINKQATVLYLQGRPEDSIALCQQVVALKPDHFGAWNGMALCAIQAENWGVALDAVRESLRLQPQSSMNRQLLRLVESRIPQV